MNDTRFEIISDLLPTATLVLFNDLAAAHLGSAGDRRFIVAMSGSGTSLIFTGPSSENFDGIDRGALDELVEQQLLREKRSTRGSTNYAVTATGERFFTWLKQRAGSAIDQVEVEVLKAVDGDGFCERNPEAEQHLDEAFKLLWQRATDEQTVSTIGDHLRKALMDTTSAAVGRAAHGEQEKPIGRLRRHLDGLEIPAREANVLQQLVELADAVLKLDHRLNHVRDEIDKDRPSVTWEEVRRAAFTTALTCYELDRLAQRGQSEVAQ